MTHDIEYASPDRTMDANRRLILAEARLREKRDRVADRRRALAAITDPAKQRREAIMLRGDELEIEQTAAALARFRSRHATTK